MRKDFENYSINYQLKKDWVFPFSEVPQESEIVLYGAGDVGQAYYSQLKVTGYCVVKQWVDQKASLYQEWGFPVIKPDQLFADVDYVVIAVSESNAAREINKFITDAGIPQEKIVWNGDERLSLLQTVHQYRLGDPIRTRLKEAFRRKGIDSTQKAVEKYIENISRKSIGNDVLILPRLVVEITSVCTLHCAKCNNLMPLYKSPKSVHADDVIGDLEIIMRTVDQIVTLELIGGEPFAHKQLSKILDYVLRQDKVTEVELTTNGSLIPDKALVERLQDKKITIKVSRYPCIDSQGVIELFAKTGIRYETFEEMQWIDSGGTELRLRTKDDIKIIYSRCYSGIYCKTLYKGKLYACARAASLYDLGICNDKDGYLDIREKIDLRDSIRRFFLKQEDPSCYYCDYTETWRLITAGKQL